MRRNLAGAAVAEAAAEAVAVEGGGGRGVAAGAWLVHRGEEEIKLLMCSIT